jgi:branched-chain amino acid transport system substrate-binding protein
MPAHLSTLARICLLLCLALLPMACTQQAEKKTDAENRIEYNMAVIVPQTGPLAFLGTPIVHALEIAADDFRKELSGDGLDIRLQYGDSQGKPQTAVTVFRQMTAARDFHAIFSYLSGQTKALKPLVAEEGKLYIASTVDDSVCDDSRLLLRPYYSFRKEGDAMVDLVNEMKPATVAIIYSQDSSSSWEVEQVVLPGLKGHGFSPVVQSFEPNSKDFRAQVTAIRDRQPDIILIFGFGPDLLQLVRQMKTLGLYDQTKVIGSLAISEAIVAEGSAEEFVGLHYFEPTFYHQKEGLSQTYDMFKAEYIKRFGSKEFQQSCVYAYDSYLLLVRALHATRSTSAETIADFLLDNPIEGLAGRYDFDETGNCDLPIAYVHVEEGGELKVARTF